MRQLLKILHALPGINVVFFIVSGCLSLLLFWYAISSIPSYYYRECDDAFILFSHAKNLVDYGFVGVNPSGERIEGFSSPLQFILFATAYFSTTCSPQLFILLQTHISTFLIGCLYFVLFRLFGMQSIFALSSAFLGSWFLTRSAAFLEWHHSGMENAITHVMYLASAILCIWMTKKNRYPLWSGFFLAIAGYARFESVFYIAPFVMLTVIISGYNNQWRAIPARKMAACFFGFWCLLFALRYLYFGQVLPNTAYAQNISLSRNLLRLITAEAGAIQLDLTCRIFTTYLGTLLIPVALIAPCMRKKPGMCREISFIIAPIATALLHASLFGSARLDPPRTASFLAVFIVAFALIIISRIRLNRGFLLLLPAIIFVPQFRDFFPKQPYVICAAHNAFLPLNKAISEYNTKENIHRPTVAFSDLGATSYIKKFNILDTGLLGNDFLAKTADQKAVADYFFEIAAPDYIEFHAYWSCRYSFLFKDPRLTSLYDMLAGGRCSWLEQNCKDFPYALSGYWSRKAMRANSTDRERVLHNNLTKNVSPGYIKEELASCQINEKFDCLYIPRQVYHFMPEIRSSGRRQEFETVFEALPDSPFRTYALALLRSDLQGNSTPAIRELLSSD